MSVSFPRYEIQFRPKIQTLIDFGQDDHDTMPPANANRITARHYEELGKTMLKRGPNAGTGLSFQRAYRELFGCGPRVCVTLWRHCDARLHNPGAKPVHVLYACLLIKVYATTAVLAAIAGCTTNTYSKWAWIYVLSIWRLRPRVVSFSCYITNHSIATATILPLSICSLDLL